MLDGWYCRSIANMQATEAASMSSAPPAEPPRAPPPEDYSSDSSSEPEPETNYKSHYLTLKKKLKYLIYVSTISTLNCNDKYIEQVKKCHVSFA